MKFCLQGKLELFRAEQQHKEKEVTFNCPPGECVASPESQISQ